MKWFDLVNRYRYIDDRTLARVMAQMWLAAANSGSDALLSNLCINMGDAYFVANALDYAGIPVDGGE